MPKNLKHLDLSHLKNITIGELCGEDVYPVHCHNLKEVPDIICDAWCLKRPEDANNLTIGETCVITSHIPIPKLRHFCKLVSYPSEPSLPSKSLL